jgi:hypothetical protein
MTKTPELGKLEGVYGISPAYLQRAVIVAIVSFVFFLLMLVAFSLRQNIGYFLLATAFLIVNLFTLSGWVMQKRAEFKLYENGFTYKKHVCRWDEIESIAVRTESRASGTAKISCEIRKIKGERIVLTEAIQSVESIINRIDAEIAKRSVS